MENKLKKSKNKVLFGVCGGLAEYWDMDPTLVRIITGVAACVWGVGVVAYIIAAVVMPKAE